ncbi:acyltransferase [Vibrio cholerae]|uniref:Acyltransferase n=3 Tax=Vibrio cholerae TaxID=666 RepID=A0A655YRR4_VIBCL|nr:acyltransferase [Vibrio cholerae]CSC46206.1 acyltransferase [Vibrio cholerae]
MGRMQRIVVHIDLLPVDEQVQGDYFNDKQFKRQFQLWLSEVWQRKDQRLEQIYKAD